MDSGYPLRALRPFEKIRLAKDGHLHASTATKDAAAEKYGEGPGKMTISGRKVVLRARHGEIVEGLKTPRLDPTIRADLEEAKTSIERQLRELDVEV